jgi:hypothetical protein
MERRYLWNIFLQLKIDLLVPEETAGKRLRRLVRGISCAATTFPPAVLRIRIRMFLGLLDPDPLVLSTLRIRSKNLSPFHEIPYMKPVLWIPDILIRIRSTSVVDRDPYADWIRVQSDFWIRIRIRRKHFKNFIF